MVVGYSAKVHAGRHWAHPVFFGNFIRTAAHSLKIFGEAAAVHGGPIIFGNVFVDGEHGFSRFGAVDNGIIKHGRRNQVKFKL